MQCGDLACSLSPGLSLVRRRLAFSYDLGGVHLDRDLPGIWRFIDLLPIEDPEEIVSLQEGNTPLIPSNLSERSVCGHSGNGKAPIRPAPRRIADSP